MPVSVERGDAERIARNLGKAGKPEPDWVRADPGWHAAYNDAAGIVEPTPPAEPEPAPAPKAEPAAKPAAKAAPRKQAATRPAQRKPAPARPRPRSTGYRGRTGIARLAGSGGDGTGIVLALVLYPIGLSIVKYGAAGPGLYFRAKWLNQTPGQNTSSGGGQAATFPSSLGPVTSDGVPAGNPKSTRQITNPTGQLPPAHLRPSGSGGGLGGIILGPTGNGVSFLSPSQTLPRGRISGVTA